MINDEYDDVDLRYLQCKSFLLELQKPRVRPRNLFISRMAANLQAGFTGQFDLETIAAVLDAAASARPGRVINVSLVFMGGGAQMEVCSIEHDTVSICADMAANLLPALYWYRAQGHSQLHVAVSGPSLFWLPLPTGTQSSE
ncbi:MAG: hypothetical protein K2X80_04970 [Pseudomonadaceae bacterium]|nr:hypothetical protein [Pseudomonadaceae bacterium]